MSEQPLGTRIEAFCQRLGAISTGDRARLKRAAGRLPHEALETLALFYHLLPGPLGQQQENRFFMLATLYPLADEGQTGNLGNALRQARNEQNQRGLDRRLEILLDADESQLPFRLRQAIRLLKANSVNVEWTRLLRDLLYWDHPDRFVQREWARSYFGSAEQE